MKKVGKWGALGFLAFYLVSQPHKAANVVHGALGGLMAPPRHFPVS